MTPKRISLKWSHDAQQIQEVVGKDAVIPRSSQVRKLRPEEQLEMGH